jgi:carboxyl-terminal processing protease
MSRRLALLALAFTAAILSSSAKAQDPARIDKIFARIEENKGATLWDDVRDLRENAKESLDAIRQGLTRADANVRIAAAATLYGAELRDEGIEALLQVAKDSKQDGARSKAAHAASLVTEADGRLLTTDQRTKFHGRFMGVASESDDELVKVHLYRGAYTLTENLGARRALREIFEKPSRPQVKDEAALALASTDAFEAVRSHLRAMSAQPGENGRLARAWIKYDTAARQREKAEDRQPTESGPYALLEDIIQKLERNYYDPKLIDRKKLIEAGARGMLSSLDPYSAFYDRKMIDQLRKEELEGHYGGIGARVMMRRNTAGVLWLTITEPIFSGPAYRAGLRSNDIITAVEGEETANKDQEELVRKLRGKPGTMAKIKVYRRGWKEAKEFTIKREEVQLETTMSEMLPGDIGYVNYTTFGNMEAELMLKKSNIETQIKALAEQGMKALILDIRFNSGGYLRTAEQIAGMFLEDGQVILTTKPRNREVQTYAAQKPRGRLEVTVPTILLVNEFSASASEILAGALQHYKRATLVGERTFGKGSVQEVKEIELDSLLIRDEKGEPILDENGRKQYGAAARITTAKWFLPSGKTVEKERIGEKEGEAGDPETGKEKKETGGVDPDIKVTFPEMDLWKVAEFEKLRASGKIEDYVTKEFPANKELFQKLAVMDSGDYHKYPDYDALYASLGSRASKEEVRELVREYVRKRVQDDRQKAFYMDLQLDVQLQRAILEACKATKQEAKKIKEYEHFAVAK